jgi:3-phenylpropionate/cinnamic acid dioxygenase small subunit
VREPPRPTPTLEAPLERMALQYCVERFLNYEAELLDGRYFDAWLDLLAEDIRYWMPLSQNFCFGDWADEHTREGHDLNWFDEGKFELEQRVRQIQTGKHWAEEPVSRTTHVVANVEVEERDEQCVDVHSRFVVYRNRTETEWDLFMGKRKDTLRRVGAHFQIARREIYLDQNVLLAKNLTIFF